MQSSLDWKTVQVGDIVVVRNLAETRVSGILYVDTLCEVKQIYKEEGIQAFFYDTIKTFVYWYTDPLGGRYLSSDKRGCYLFGEMQNVNYTLHPESAFQGA